MSTSSRSIAYFHINPLKPRNTRTHTTWFKRTWHPTNFVVYTFQRSSTVFHFWSETVMKPFVLWSTISTLKRVHFQRSFQLHLAQVETIATQVFQTRTTASKTEGLTSNEQINQKMSYVVSGKWFAFFKVERCSLTGQPTMYVTIQWGSLQTLNR